LILLRDSALPYLYIWLDKFFDMHEMLVDIAKRKFITVGFTASMLLIPLAITSTSGWIRRLGGRRWNRLHQLIYLAAIAGVTHYYWRVKADVRKPLQYAAVLSLLLGYRLVIAVFRNSGKQRCKTPAPARASL
jgi:methionine sulfoxide reductase heme-binding subunit